MRDYDAWVVITVMVVQNLRTAIAKKQQLESNLAIQQTELEQLQTQIPEAITTKPCRESHRHQLLHLNDG